MQRPNRFFGLHGHSGASIFDGFGSPKEHFDFVLENQMDGMAITEHGHMNSFAEAMKYAKKLQKDGRAFKYVPGVEFYMHPDLGEWEKLKIKKAEEKKQQKDQASDDEDSTITVEDETATKQQKWRDPLKRRHHLVVLPKNKDGLDALFSLVSFGYTKGQYYFPRIDFHELKQKANDNLIVSTACLGGPFAYEVFDACSDLEFDDVTYDKVKDRGKIILPRFENLIDQFVDAVGEKNFFLELQFNKLPSQHVVNHFLIKASKKTGIPLVATADSHYPRAEQWKERELYKRLRPSKGREEEKLPESIDELKCELYPKNAEQMWEEYLSHKDQYDFYDDKIVKDAIEKSYDVAHDLIGDVTPDASVKLPSYTVPEGEKPMQALSRMAREGLKAKGLDEKEEYVERLLMELKVIKEKKFAKYFLTMKAIMDLAKKNMLCGFGRGSAAGSLLCYCLGITGIDPIKYDLLFSRFLDLNREELPDIDSDFSDREKLRKLLSKEYGEENVIAISNVNKLSLKSLTKDLAKYFYGQEIFEESNKATRFVDKDIMLAARAETGDKTAYPIDFEHAIKYSAPFAEFIAKYPLIGEWISKMMGEARSLSRHAGGIILSEKVLDRMPVIASKGVWQTPWTKDYLEPLGWVKFDLLGLETLAIIERCIELILQRHEGIKKPTFDQIYEWYSKHLDPDVIDLDDQHVYKHIYEGGKFAGVFQCFCENTPILMHNKKNKKIKDLLVGDEIISLNVETNEYEKDVVVHKFDNGIRECIEICLEDGKKLVCTEDHLFYTDKGWIKAKNLNENHEILSYK